MNVLILNVMLGGGKSNGSYNNQPDISPDRKACSYKIRSKRTARKEKKKNHWLFSSMFLLLFYTSFCSSVKTGTTGSLKEL